MRCGKLTAHRVGTPMFKSKAPWLSLLLLVQSAPAEITLAPLFQEGGVLQCEKPVPVWGRATAGKAVSVGFGGQTKTTTADASGRWQVTLAALTVSAESRTITVTEAGLPAVEV